MKTKEKDYLYMFSKKQLKAIVESLQYDLKENGYNFIKDDLQMNFRILIGELKYKK
jgi:hypothetical protein